MLKVARFFIKQNEEIFKARFILLRIFEILLFKKAKNQRNIINNDFCFEVIFVTECNCGEIILKR